MASAESLRKQAAAKKAEANMYGSKKREGQLRADLQRQEQETKDWEAKSQYTDPSEIIGGIIGVIGFLIVAAWFFAG